MIIITDYLLPGDYGPTSLIDESADAVEALDGRL